MKFRSTVAAALFLSTLGALAGCSADDSSGDLDRALQELRNPTGSFNKETGSGAFSGYKSEQAESSRVDRPSTGSGTSQGQSIRLLTRTLDAKAQCAEGQDCACEKSGSFTYKQEPSNEGTALSFKFDNCAYANGTSFDGVAKVLATQQPLLGVGTKAKKTPTPTPAAGSDGGSSGAASGLSTADANTTPATSSETPNILMTAKGTAKSGEQSLALEFALVIEAGYTLLSVQVPDGKIVVGVAADGTGFVKAKQGTWNCTPKSGNKGYACVSADSGEELAVDDAEVVTANDGETPASGAGSSDGDQDTIVDGDDELGDDFGDQ